MWRNSWWGLFVANGLLVLVTAAITAALTVRVMTEGWW